MGLMGGGVGGQGGLRGGGGGGGEEKGLWRSLEGRGEDRGP